MTAATTGKLPLSIKLANGFGAIAFGVKDIGFSFFLLTYYTQVLGMDASTVGKALLIALLIDGFADPIIGYLSDRTYTRWGRRLPWLYIAPFPLAIAWTILWAPPTGAAPSFIGLLITTVTVRLLLSACEVPSASLVPEITADYDERTTLFRFRHLSGWIGGLTMMFLAFNVFMPGEGGTLKPDGYAAFGITGALLMVISVVGSAWGQHKLVARLPDRKPGPFSLSGAFSEIREAFSEHAFVIYAIGALGAYCGQGLSFSMTQYLNYFVWQLSPFMLKIYPFILLLSAILMFFIVSPMHRKFGKPKSAAISAVVSLTLFALPYVLLYGGLWPAVGSDTSSALYLIIHLFSSTFGIVVMISATSMIAEIIELHQERTGKRVEASFYSGNWFIQKCATGVGIFLTGMIVSYSLFPKDAIPGQVDGTILNTLIALYCVVNSALLLWAAFWLARFPISREDHEARIAKMAADTKERNI